MNSISEFDNLLSAEEKNIINGLTSPFLIQKFLDSVQYPSEDRNRSVLGVLRERQGHCLDGGLFGAAMLQRLGFPAMIVDILPEPGTDDDHVLAVYQVHGGWGAVAKSNFIGLRLREPVYRSIRELVMSYFEVYFNVDGIKTMRGYTRKVDLSKYDRYHWLVDSHGVDVIEKRLKNMKVIPVINPQVVGILTKVDELAYQAGLAAANLDGLYKPKV